MVVELFPTDRTLSSPNLTDPNASGVDGGTFVVERWTSTGADGWCSLSSAIVVVVVFAADVDNPVATV